MLMKLSLILFGLCFTHPVIAYNLRAETIVKKMTGNNGQREYKIVREVDLSSPERKIKAREVWTVAHGDKMKLQVSSLDATNPWNFSILYNSKNRKTLSRKKALKSFKKSNDFFEPLFHDRYHKSLLNRLIAYKFVPPWAKQSTPPTYEDGETKMTPEPFIHLAPMEGTVNYALGAKSNSQGSQNKTMLWIEQDSFVIRKGRLQSDAEFVNSQYQNFVGGLKLPGEQQISWSDKVARIKLLTAERVTTQSKDWALEKTDEGNIPTDPLIKEFYSRFR